MIADHDPAFQSIHAVLRILQEQRYERLDLENLRGLLHQNVVVLEAELDQFTSFQRRMCTGHRDDLRLLDQQVVAALQVRSEYLERSELLQFGEDLLDVLEALVRDVQVVLERLAVEQFGQFGEVVTERKQRLHTGRQSLGPFHLVDELLVFREDVVQVEVRGGFAGVADVRVHI